MAASRKKRKRKKSRQSVNTLVAAMPQPRTGMPAEDSVEEVTDFVSPKGVKYKILKTTEMDGYDATPRSAKKRTKPRP